MAVLRERPVDLVSRGPQRRLKYAARFRLPLLVAIPVILTAAVPDWMYSGPSVIDAWIYNGFFRHLEVYATTMFPGTYYGTRLGWILPGYTAYHVFESRLAAFVLHLTFYVVAIGSLYGIVRRIAGEAPALFAAVAFAWYMPVVRAIGSDYVDGPVITYGLLAAWLAFEPERTTRWWRLLASGVAAGAMLHSNIGAGFVLPSILLWFLPPPPALRWKPLVINLLLWTAGIVLCTALLAVFSFMTTARWDFFTRSFTWLLGQGGSNPYQAPPGSLVSTAPWVLLPAATAVGALSALLVSRIRRRLSSGQVRAIAAFVSLVVVFAIWDLAGPGAVFYWPFYNSWLLPWSFIVIGAVLLPAGAVTKIDGWVMLASACVILASLAWPERIAWPVPGYVGLAILCTLFVVATLAPTRPIALPLVALGIAALHGWLSLTSWYGRVDDRADAFRAIDDGVRVIERYVARDEPRFLLTREGGLGHYIQGLTSVYLWGFSIASQDFLDITPRQAAQVQGRRVVIVVDERPDTAAKFDEVFARYRLKARMLGAEQVATIHGPLYLTFLEPVPLASE